MARHRHGHRDREPRVREHQHREVRGVDRDEQVDQRRPAQPQRRDHRAVGQPQHLAPQLGPARLVAGAQRERPAEQRRQQPEPARPEHGRQQVLEAGPDADRVGDGTVRALERRLQRQQQQGADGGRSSDRGHRPPAARRQAAVGIDVGERERPQEEQRPFRPDDERPDPQRSSRDRSSSARLPRPKPAITNATDSAPPSRIHATRTPAPRSTSTSPTQAGVPTPSEDAHGIPQADRDVLAARLRDGAGHDARPTATTRARRRRRRAGGRTRCTPAILSHALPTRHGASPESYSRLD